MKNTLLALLCFLILGLASTGVEATQKPIRIVTLEYAPLEYIDQSGELKGAAVEIVREIFKDLDIPISIEVLPWARAIRSVKEGTRDAIFTAFRNKEREKFLDYCSEVLINQYVSLYALVERNIQFDGDLEKLKNYQFGIVSNISYGKKFDELARNGVLKTQRVEQLNHNFMKLKKGRIDIVINNRFGGDYELSRYSAYSSIKRLAPDVDATPSYFAFSKKSGMKETLKKFTAKLKEFKSNGRYKKILQKYNIYIETKE